MIDIRRLDFERTDEELVYISCNERQADEWVSVQYLYDLLEIGMT